MKRQSLLPIILVVLLASCGSSTKLTKSWIDPSLTAAHEPFKKVLVLGLVKDEATRRVVEDKLAAQFPGRAVQSYSYLSAADTVDAQVETKLKNDGFDGLVYMKLAEVEKSTSYVPGTTYGGFYGYRGYGYGYGGYGGTSGYYQEDKNYNVETNIYALQPPKLLWSGVTTTVNPSKLGKTVDDIIMTIKDELVSKKVIK